ncbi:uncharacterized protein [Ptychodera flava]|uniref:uncharacterized protein n=1 Tax=Ptychodera flava TaxID=63121 RepID=UPI003969F884
MGMEKLLALHCLLTFWLQCSNAAWHTRCNEDDCSQRVGSRYLPCSVTKQTPQNADGKCSGMTSHRLSGHYDVPSLGKDDVEIAITSDNFKRYGEFPGMNVKVSVPLTEGNQRVEGIQIILRGKTKDDSYHYTYHGQEICRILTLDGDAMARRSGDPKSVTFSYNCLRPLSPESEYEVEVNLLPLPERRPHSKVIRDVRTPACDSDKGPDFNECFVRMAKYKAVHWGPTIFEAMPRGRNVSVNFNLPDESYELDRFRVLLYTENGDYMAHRDIEPGKDDIHIIAASNGEMYSVVQFTPFTDVENGRYIVKIQPIPTKEGVCESLSDGTTDCKVTVSDSFVLEANEAEEKVEKPPGMTRPDKKTRRGEKRRRKTGKGRKKDRSRKRERKSRRKTTE